VTVDRTRFRFVGKWLEAEAEALGLRATNPPAELAMTGIDGRPVVIFYRKRIVKRRGRQCAEYESHGGRIARLWLEGQEDAPARQSEPHGPS